MVAGLVPMEAAERLNKYKRMFGENKRKWDSYVEGEMLFGLPITKYPELEETQREIDLLDKLYGLYVNVVQTIKGYGNLVWADVVSNIDSMTEVCMCVCVHVYVCVGGGILCGRMWFRISTA